MLFFFRLYIVLEYFVFMCFFFLYLCYYFFFFFFQAEDGIRDPLVTGVQTCALPILEFLFSPLPRHDSQPAGDRVPHPPTTPSARQAADRLGWPAESPQPNGVGLRSEERRVGKEGRTGGGVWG